MLERGNFIYKLRQLVIIKCVRQSQNKRERTIRKSVDIREKSAFLIDQEVILPVEHLCVCSFFHAFIIKSAKYTS